MLVKNSATQSGEYVTCIFGLLFFAQEFVQRRQWIWLLASVTAILGMLASIFYVSTGRTALVIIPVLLLLFAVKRLDYRSAFILFGTAALIGSISWVSSPYLRHRTEAAWIDFRHYQLSDEQNSSGERAELQKKSMRLCT